MTSTILQFKPLETRISATFWHELHKRKLDVYKLKDDPIPLTAFYKPGSPFLDIDYSSFPPLSDAPSRSIPEGSFAARGILVNANTADQFSRMDKRALLEKLTGDSWQEATVSSWCCARFLVVAHADLKRHEFAYVSAVLAMRFAGADVREAGGGARKATDAESASASAALSGRQEAGWSWVTDGSVVAVADPSDDGAHAGWTLRNVIAAIVASRPSLRGKAVTALCHRGHSRDTLAVPVLVPDVKEGEAPVGVGWETPKPRVVSLASAMDPRQLAETAVDLNLKLMRWRMFAELDLGAVSSTRCLLLGAGTLGCNVARALVGWGVRKITFVDNARVSFSNPVRQTLFTFEDCLEGGRWKAEAAADRLARVFPGVEAVSHVLTIPMPGHAVSKADEERTRAAADKVEALIKEHDTVFLLSDSRECRWLPTLLGAVHRKLVITVGLGFDSYVVMRHGVSADDGDAPHLGCYFCSDVVAPRDSMTDRTLDQACTVTRPGVSMVASALACELLVSVLHHPLGRRAPAEGTCALGTVPHQLRGFLSQWSTMPLTGAAYDRCVACSAAVTGEFRKRGFSFLLEAFNNPTYLEDVTGLTRIRLEQEQQQAHDGAACSWSATGDEGDDF